jgi:hypothetical protein
MEPWEDKSLQTKVVKQLPLLAAGLVFLTAILYFFFES